ncbi:hypothetical protein FNF27_00762 [Cafeteria roenbergensis]|nr:hypothetical protein FNF31_04026 [Cafeteria roenbergensis]KAA0177592.1 hypothetical protein FNF27_00762 [Cafeteria roenbergensis]
MLTGMFPHEIVIRLPASATVRQVQISSMNLGSVKVSRASGPAPGSWNELCSFDMSPTPGVMQSESADCDAGEATFVRFQFLSGVAAFAAVYSLAVIS